MHKINIAEILPFLKLVGVPGGTGGSGGEDEASLLDSLIDGSITGSLNSNASHVREKLFVNCTGLTALNFPNATSIGSDAFSGCSNLKTANFPMVNDIRPYVFKNCSSLTSINVPLIEDIESNAFTGCGQLKILDFLVADYVGYYAFWNCTSLTAVVLRFKTSIATLYNVNAFSNTPIESGTGYIYVPSALIERYKAASNWSTYAAQFRALEDYTVDGTITGELDESKI